MDCQNTPKSFEVAVNGNVSVVQVRQLTLLELEQRSVLVVDKIKERRRKEFVETAALLPAKDRQAFLVKACTANTPTVDDINEEQDRVWCLLWTLALATGKPETEIQALFNASPSQVLDMYLYSLGIDGNDKEEAPDQEPGFQPE